MDIHDRLRGFMTERGWSEYRLSKNTGLAESTLSNIFKRSNVPTIATLETICRGFGITLSQFFADGDMVELTPDTKALFDAWAVLTPKQKAAVLQLIQAMNSDDMEP